MNNQLVEWSDKQLLRKRAVIESSSGELRHAKHVEVPTALIGQLKHICQIGHSRHRSPTNFVANLFAGLIAYCHFSKKPSQHVCATEGSPLGQIVVFDDWECYAFRAIDRESLSA